MRNLKRNLSHLRNAKNTLKGKRFESEDEMTNLGEINFT